MRRRDARGFGLLEAIVALALLAGTGVALFAWINQNLRQASALRERELQSRLQLDAQQLVDTVNPMASPQGRLAVGALEVTWTSRELQPQRRNASEMGLVPGPWRVGLYALSVQATDRRSGVATRFEQWRVGTQRAEPVAALLP